MKYPFAVIAAIGLGAESGHIWYGFALLWSLLSIFYLVEDATDKIITAIKEKQ